MDGADGRRHLLLSRRRKDKVFVGDDMGQLTAYALKTVKAMEL